MSVLSFAYKLANLVHSQYTQERMKHGKIIIVFLVFCLFFSIVSQGSELYRGLGCVCVCVCVCLGSDTPKGDLVPLKDVKARCWGVIESVLHVKRTY